MGENSSNEKPPAVERVARTVFTPERLTEGVVGQVMIGLENWHDMTLVPERYGLSPDQVGKLPTFDSPVAQWAFDHIGDIWEISVGHTAMRLGFVALNQALKSEPVKKLTGGKEVQIPDDACFWASLITSMTVVSTHSMGMWAGPYNSHVGAPVPEMIFGQAVAAVVLATSHYAVKYHEPIGKLAIKVAERGKEVLNKIDKKKQEFDNYLGISNTPNVAVNREDKHDGVS